MTDRFLAPDATNPRYITTVDAVLAAALTAPPAGSSIAPASSQLLLYTLDGISEVLEWNNEGAAADEFACIWLAFTRWLRTTGAPVSDNVPFALDRPIDALPLMSSSAHQEASVVDILNTGQMQLLSKSSVRHVNSPSVLIWSTAFGLLPVKDYQTVTKLSSHTCALTHGDSRTVLSAMCVALLVRSMASATSDASVEFAVRELRDWLANYSNADFAAQATSVLALVDQALAARNEPLTVEHLRQKFEDARTASQMLAAALYLLLHVERTIAETSTPEDIFNEFLSDVCEIDAALTGNDQQLLYHLVAILLAAAYPTPMTAISNVSEQAHEAIDLLSANWRKQLGIA